MICENIGIFWKKIDEIINNEQDNKGISVEKILSHYYIPLLLTEIETIDYIQRRICAESEQEFLNSLNVFISKNDIGKSFGIDWWLFCRTDELLDKIYIPYYDPDNNSIRKYYPTFIFWIKKGKKYHIVLVDQIDTKAQEFTGYIKKINGYAQIFCQDESVKVFNHSGLEIYVHLYIYNAQLKNIPEETKRYGYPIRKKYLKCNILFFCKTIYRKESSPQIPSRFANG